MNTLEGYVFEEESQGVEAWRLSANGMQVLLHRQAAAPVVTFMVTYRVGSRHEPSGLTGATHFLEHLLFKGSERFNRRTGTSVFNVLQRVGARINATTWLDRTNYFEMLPRDYLPLAIEVEADRMRGALLDPEDVESERTVILNELDRGENDPEHTLWHALWSTAFVAHPYRHPTIGWRSDVERVTADGLRGFYDTYYWPDNTTACIIGDFDREEALELVRRCFGSIVRTGNGIPIPHTREPVQQGERRVTVRRQGHLGAVMIAYKSPPGLHADTDALAVLSVLLCSGKSSRLYRLLTDRGVTTNVYGGASRFHDPGLTYLFARLNPDRTPEEVESAIYEVLDDVRQNGVTEEELHRARMQQKALEAFGRDGPFAVAAQLNEAVAAGDWRLYTTIRERIERVTTDDVCRVARKYFIEDARTVGVYLPTNGSPA